MQHAAVLSLELALLDVGFCKPSKETTHRIPKPIKPHRSAFCLILICTFRKMMIGNPERMKSEMMEMTSKSKHIKVNMGRKTHGHTCLRNNDPLDLTSCKAVCGLLLLSNPGSVHRNALQYPK